MENELRINVKNGYIRATLSSDPEYPGIWVEFVSDKDEGQTPSRPQILFEQPAHNFPEGQVRALIWDNPEDEDYTQEIIFREVK